MDTPGTRPGPIPTLYGGTARAINRRTLVTGGLLLPLAAAAKPVQDPIDTELAKIKALRWTGRAQIQVQPQPLELVVETRVEPFVRAWTRSRLLRETPDRTRRLRVEGDKAYILVEDLETDLMPRQALHEREQYGLYGYMLRMLVHQKLLASAGAREKLFFTQDSHPGFPPIEFGWDVAAGRIGEAHYAVHEPFGEGMIQQQITFSGEIGDPALRWPRTIDVAQNGKPYFKLTLESFTIEPA